MNDDELYICAICEERHGKKIKELRARVAKLEAATQWQPASEPPDNPENVCRSDVVEVQLVSGHVQSDFYDYQRGEWFFSLTPLRWRDLPALPEVEK